MLVDWNFSYLIEAKTWALKNINLDDWVIRYLINMHNLDDAICGLENQQTMNVRVTHDESFQCRWNDNKKKNKTSNTTLSRESKILYPKVNQCFCLQSSDVSSLVVKGWLWFHVHATTQWTRSRFDVVVNLYGSASGLRVVMHVHGKERTNSWSLSVHAITLQFLCS